MFKRPKMEDAGPTPDPTDLANRRETERKRRTATGGRQSTVLAQAMQTARAAPTAVLTGNNG